MTGVRVGMTGVRVGMTMDGRGSGNDLGGCGNVTRERVGCDVGRGSVERVYVIPAKAGIWRVGGDMYSLAVWVNESNGAPPSRPDWFRLLCGHDVI